VIRYIVPIILWSVVRRTFPNIEPFVVTRDGVGMATTGAGAMVTVILLKTIRVGVRARRLGLAFLTSYLRLLVNTQEDASPIELTSLTKG